MALEQQTIALIGVGVVIIGVTVGLHSITQADIRALGTSVDSLRGDVADVGQRVAVLEPRVGSIDQTLARLEERVDGFDQRISAVDQRLGGINQRLTRVETSLDTVLALSGGTEEAQILAEEEGADVLATAEAMVTGADVIAEASAAPPAELNSDNGDIVPAAYRILKEKDHSFGNIRRRVTLEIEMDGADPASRTTIETLMRAAYDRLQVDRPDAVSVRLWRSYEDDSNAQNRVVYAPDGCGWSGDSCTGELWTDLLKGDLPSG
jgi:hypothetical protein